MSRESYKEPVIRVAQYVPVTLSEGPYRRFAIWVQGCSIQCPGCCNQEMFNASGGNDVQVETLRDLVLETEGIEGLTLLGGEPFDQAKTLSRLTGDVRKAGLGVMIFSGYTLDDIGNMGSAEQSLLENTDVLVAGPYIQKEHVYYKRWIGSDNQRVHFLTSRYRNCSEFRRPGQSIHISFSEDSFTITGFPDLFPDNN